MCPGCLAAVDGLVQQDASRGSCGAGAAGPISGWWREQRQYTLGAQADTGLGKVMANVHVRMCLTTMLP